MIRKFFPLDKNYLLEEAQLVQEESLLTLLIENVKLEYQWRHNPLQLQDSFSERVRTFKPGTLSALSPFYQTLAGAYRYRYGNNQLELLWGGESHFTKYQQDWREMFIEWTTGLCRSEQFIQAVLDLTVFLPENRTVQMSENRMNFAMMNFLDIRVHKSRGIVDMKIA